MKNHPAQSLVQDESLLPMDRVYRGVLALNATCVIHIARPGRPYPA
jgi:hypothetical protein